MPDITLQQTPLHDRHVALGARMVDFAGFHMPVQYSGIIDEHLAVREAAGLFDVSHMGEVEVTGPEAFQFVQRLVTNDVSKLYDGKALYTVMCRPDGGVVDDLLVYRRAEDRYLLVINAANIAKDVAWMRSHNEVGAQLVDASDRWALLALQGPRSLAIAQAASDLDLSELAYYHFVEPTDGAFLGLDRVIVSRTGYTGELGLEIYCAPEAAARVWDSLLEAGQAHGLKPAGLGARDTLRLEAGFALYGNDLTDETNPLEAGLGWVTKLDKGPFVGREALQKVKAEGSSRKLVGFVLEERGVPRPGYPLLSPEGREIGVVTSGSQSPVLGKGIGMGYVDHDPALTTPGSRLGVRVRSRALAATVTKPPFHKQPA